MYEKQQFDLNNMSRSELIELQSKIFVKLKEFIGHLELKTGQRILIGDKFADKEPFYYKENYKGSLIAVDEYEGIVGEYGFIISDELGIYDYDVNGNPIPFITITLERDNDKKIKNQYLIHPDDAIIVKDK